MSVSNLRKISFEDNPELVSGKKKIEDLNFILLEDGDIAVVFSKPIKSEEYCNGIPGIENFSSACAEFEVENTTYSAFFM